MFHFMFFQAVHKNISVMLAQRSFRTGHTKRLPLSYQELLSAWRNFGGGNDAGCLVLGVRKDVP